MKTFNNDPNFSIVLPGCNAKCSFCFNKEQPQFNPINTGEYLNRLGHLLSMLPDQFYQISITGGEPVISPIFDILLGFLVPFKPKYNNILLTTNGTGLEDKMDMISYAVDHINVSRHHWDEERNRAIFGGSYKLHDDDLFYLVDEYGKRGIDVSVNCVIDELTNKDFIITFIDWARRMGFYAIRFRKKNGDIKPLKVEGEFSSYKILWEGTCPVCRTKLQRIRGIDVYWKSSTLEPSDTIKDVFELIYEPDGKVYLDWSGGREFDPSSLFKKKERKENTYSRYTGGSSGGGSCGGSTSRC